MARPTGWCLVGFRPDWKMGAQGAISTVESQRPRPTGKNQRDREGRGGGGDQPPKLRPAIHRRAARPCAASSAAMFMSRLPGALARAFCLRRCERRSFRVHVVVPDDSGDLESIFQHSPAPSSSSTRTAVQILYSSGTSMSISVQDVNVLERRCSWGRRSSLDALVSSVLDEDVRHREGLVCEPRRGSRLAAW